MTLIGVPSRWALEGLLQHTLRLGLVGATNCWDGLLGLSSHEISDLSDFWDSWRQFKTPKYELVFFFSLVAQDQSSKNIETKQLFTHYSLKQGRGKFWTAFTLFKPEVIFGLASTQSCWKGLENDLNESSWEVACNLEYWCVFHSHKASSNTDQFLWQ